MSDTQNDIILNKAQKFFDYLQSIEFEHDKSIIIKDKNNHMCITWKHCGEIK